VFLPQSALEALLQRRITYPMHFMVRNRATGAVTHAGVLEFTADEGQCFAPRWMMGQLGLSEGGVVEVAYTVLPLAKHLRLQPRSSAFLDISDHRAVLEYVMTAYSALTVGDEIVLHYNHRDYVLLVREVRPDNVQHAVSIVETNVSIEFDPPADAPPPAPAAAAASDKASGGAIPTAPTPSQSTAPQQRQEGQAANGEAEFMPFSGRGCRLDGRPVGTKRQSSTSPSSSSPPPPPQQQQRQSNAATEFVPFCGVGRSLAGGTVTATTTAEAPSTSKTNPPQQQGKKSRRFTAFSGEGHKLQ